MPTLLHLNGPSGVGKSTLARAHAAARPGTLVCDIDDLRSWVSGWDEDFIGTGEAVRTGALALITAYLRSGRDVVLPQLIVTPAQLDRFEAAAAEAGASYVGVVLSLAPEKLLDRLHAREETPITAVISRIITERGGDDLVVRGGEQLLELAGHRGIAVVDATDHDSALQALAELLPPTPWPGRCSDDPSHPIEPLEQVVGGELDGLVPPLGGPVDAGDEAAAVDPAEVTEAEGVARLGPVVGALGQAEVPGGVVGPVVRREEDVLRLSVGLDVAPVAVEDVLPGVDQPLGVRDSGGVDGVGGHRSTLSQRSAAVQPGTRHPAEDFLADDPEARAVAAAVARAMDALGHHTVRVSRRQVAFRRRTGFAFLWRPDDDASGEVTAMLSIVLPREVASHRFSEVVHPSLRAWMHHLELRTPDEVDAEVHGWLSEAYDAAR